MKIAQTIAISLAIAPGALAGGDPLGKDITVETTLSAVREEPEAFKQVKVRFALQFASVGRVANPFFTRFVPSEYTNFYGWAAEQPIWRKDEYSNVFAYLFLSKDSDQLQDLYDLELYDRLLVTGVVRNTFQGAPWIEVLEFDVLGGQVSTESLAHAYRGEQMMARRQWSRAVSELSLASGPDVPESMEIAMHRNMGICYLRMGDTGDALYHLNHALSLGDERDPETSRLLLFAQTAPELELDRIVNPAQVGDHQRPFWEYFHGIEWTTEPARPGR